ncbi:MAG TPA: hypothetical protein VM285_15115, partial [Polyangia bacterium]|nr:hypothetical protein [Polyangia bacterium]
VRESLGDNLGGGDTIPKRFRNHYIDAYKIKYMRVTTEGLEGQAAHEKASDRAMQRMREDHQQVIVPSARFGQKRSIVPANQWDIGSIASPVGADDTSLAGGKLQNFNHAMSGLLDELPRGVELYPDQAVRVGMTWLVPVMPPPEIMGNGLPSEGVIGFAVWDGATGMHLISGGKEVVKEQRERLQDHIRVLAERDKKPRSTVATAILGPLSVLRPRGPALAEARAALARLDDYESVMNGADASVRKDEAIVFKQAVMAMTGLDDPRGLNPWVGLHRPPDLRDPSPVLTITDYDSRSNLSPDNPRSLAFQVTEAIGIEWLRFADRTPTSAKEDAELRDAFREFGERFVVETLGWDIETEYNTPLIIR